MSLSQKIAAALDENTKAYVLPCSVTIEESPNRLTLHITAFDTVGLACTALEFVTTRRSEWSSESLQEWGTRLAGRVTYLMEPLKVIEIDTEGGEVQIRSQSPTPRADQRGYYEIRLFREGSFGWNASFSTTPPASVAQPPASSRAKSWNAWPTISPPACLEFESPAKAWEGEIRGARSLESRPGRRPGTPRSLSPVQDDVRRGLLGNLRRAGSRAELSRRPCPKFESQRRCTSSGCSTRAWGCNS